MGATAEVFPFGDGRVVKLFRADVDRNACEYEARQARAVFESGAPCAGMYGVTEVDGRFGIIYQRLEGETLLTTLLRGDIDAAGCGQRMAAEHWRLHSRRVQAAVTPFAGWLAFNLRRLKAAGTPGHILSRVESAAATVPNDPVLCHADLHADNLFVTADGLVPIDWISALMANPLVDVARQHLSLTVLPIEDARPVARRFDAMRPAIHAAFMTQYAELSGRTAAALAREVVPFAVIMGALRLAEPVCTPLERGILHTYIVTHAPGG